MPQKKRPSGGRKPRTHFADADGGDSGSPSRDGILVTTEAHFAEVCGALANADRFAFDAEFVGEDGYEPQVCLIQVATHQDVILIDPLAGFNTGQFWDLISNPKICKVLHAGIEDLALSFQHSGKAPCNIVDVQVAAGLVDVHYPMSLQRLVRGYTGVRLHKSQTLTDWRRRPLSESQLHYASDDVAHLLPIHDRIMHQLAELGRVHWLEEEMTRFTSAETYRTEERDAAWRVKGVGALNSAALAVVRELALAREQIAARLNRPPRALLRDHLVIEIAKHGWTEPKQFRTLRGFSLSAPAVQELAEAVQRGLETPAENRPNPAPVIDERPEEVTMERLVAAVLHDFSRQHNIAYQMLATKKDIRALILAHTRGKNPMSPGGLQLGWRKEFIGELVSDVLAGRRAVRLTRGQGGTRLEIE